MTHSNSFHTFHVPVMGVAFTIDSPIKLAPYGISSVISMVDDTLLEQMRAYYCEQFNLAYQEISNKIEDFRAKRVTAYLNMVQEIVQIKLDAIKNAAWEKGSELEKYFQLLPDYASIKKDFLERIKQSGMNNAVRDWLKQHIQPGSIDINIMTKLDRENEMNGEKLPSEYNDAHAALRGFANSNLESSVVLSAGLNPRLYSYFEHFKDFYPNEKGELKKQIILKISDYRSALIQGKFLAKKGLWVSEFRMESGLNCGGHAFATDGLLMGPILEEFKQHRDELKATLFELYAAALKEKNIEVPVQPFEQKFTAQGGVGTAEEHTMLMNEYQLDSVGWGSTFLLVPEATTVDEATLKQLCDAREEDLYLSHNSPLGVRFNNIRNNSMAHEKEFMIQKNRPGSSCPKKFSVLNKEYTEDPICTASRQYQHLRLNDLKTKGLTDKEFQKEFELTTARECLCIGLSNAALMKYGIPTKHYKESVSICPGPNLAYYDKLVSLQEMVDHIYGRGNIMSRKDRPHVFIKELDLYIQFYKDAIAEAELPLTKQKASYLNSFEKNLNEGIAYYRDFFARTNQLEALDALVFQENTLNLLCASRMVEANLV
jgi:hypothetical protein